MPELTTEDQRAGADDASILEKDTGAPIVAPRRKRPWIVEFYASGVGKKWVMAVSGIILLGYVLAHMIGNLKVYLGPEEINRYGDWLRTLGEPAAPRTVVLWLMRTTLILAFVLHITSAYSLTRMNQRARPMKYQAPRDYVAANYASRTMRWTGVIVGLFVIFHLTDLTWSGSGAKFHRGDPYQNMLHSMQRPVVAGVYIVANLALALHIYHGAWSMFQSLGLTNPRFNAWRRYFATGFAVIIAIGNVSFPVMVQAGVIH